MIVIETTVRQTVEEGRGNGSLIVRTGTLCGAYSVDDVRCASRKKQTASVLFFTGTDAAGSRAFDERGFKKEADSSVSFFVKTL